LIEHRSLIDGVTVYTIDRELMVRLPVDKTAINIENTRKKAQHCKTRRWIEKIIHYL